MRHERLRVHFDKPSVSPSLSLSLSDGSPPVILYYIKLIICAARLYILFYRVALDRPAIRSVFFNARYQRGKIGLRPGKKSPVSRLVCAAPLDLTKTHSARGNIRNYTEVKNSGILPRPLTWQWGLKRCLLHVFNRRLNCHYVGSFYFILVRIFCEKESKSRRDNIYLLSIRVSQVLVTFNYQKIYQKSEVERRFSVLIWRGLNNPNLGGNVRREEGGGENIAHSLNTDPSFLSPNYRPSSPLRWNLSGH